MATTPIGGGGTKKTTAKKKPRAEASPVTAAVHHHHGQGTVAHVIAEVASSLGVPPSVALALGMYESGLDPNRIGDHGTSFGIYQLHEGGELGNHDPNWAYNVRNNALTALSAVAQVHAEHPDWDWGRVAAAAQRPADQPAEAAAVNGYLSAYHNSGETNAVSYFSSQSAAAAKPAGAGGYASGQSKETAALNSPSITSQFGYLAGYLNDPVLGPILKDYAQNHNGNEGWLLAQLEKTGWWKTHSESARRFQAMQKADPAEYKQEWAQQRQAVAATAAQLGIHIDPSRLNQLATTSLWSNWSASQIQQAIGAEFHYDPNAKYTGTAGDTISKLQSLGAQYLVPLSRQSMNQWARQVLEGKKGSADEFTNYLQDQAKTLFPWMGNAIAKGVTPDQFLDPYRQAAAQTLELDPNQINFQQDKWRKLFETVDPKTGDRSERGLANALTLMRTDPVYGFDRTQQARDEAAAFAQNIAQSFGFAGSDTNLTSGVPAF